MYYCAQNPHLRNGCATHNTQFDIRQQTAEAYREDIGLLRYLRLHRHSPRRCQDISKPVRLGDWFGELPDAPVKPIPRNVSYQPDVRKPTLLHSARLRILQLGKMRTCESGATR